MAGRQTNMVGQELHNPVAQEAACERAESTLGRNLVGPLLCCRTSVALVACGCLKLVDTLRFLCNRRERMRAREANT